MSNEFNKDGMTESEIREYLERHPEFRDKTRALSGEMRDDELINVSGGTGQHIVGTEDDDRRWVGEGLAPLYGGEGDDTIEGLGGNDSMVGEGGDDEMYGGDGNDTMYGDGTGEDPLDPGYRGPGDDYLDGGAGDDFIIGGGGDDTLLGGEGNDTLDGGSGNDTLEGGAGDDVLRAGFNYEGGDNNNVLTGGDGSDVFVFDIRSGYSEITDFEVGVDRLAFNTELGFSVESNFAGTYIHLDGADIFLEGVYMTQEEVEAHMVNFQDYNGD